MMKSNIIKMFNLPSYIKGKSFAEASKAIERKFEGKTDKYSNETKEVFMKRLSEAQEYTKQMQNPQPDMNQNQMKFGGDTEGGNTGMDSMLGVIGGIGNMIGSTSNVNNGDQAMNGIATGLEQMGQSDPSGIVSGAGTALSFGNDMFGDTNIDTSGRTEGPKIKAGAKIAGNTLEGAAAGAKIGGPWGAAIGGVVGGVSGVIGSNRAKKDSNKANLNFGLKQSNMYDNKYAMGGRLVDPVDDEEKSKTKMVDPTRIFTDPIGDGTSDNTTQAYANDKWRNLKDTYLKDALTEWRAGKTGNTRNDSFTQASPQYRDFMESTKAEFYKNNPRPVLKDKDYYSNEMAKGGYTNDYNIGGPFPDFSNVFEYIKNNPQGNDEIDYSIGAPPSTQRVPQSTILANSGLERKGFEPMMPGLQESALKGSQELIDNINKDNNTNNKLSNNKTSFAQRAGVEALRYAPVIGNALQLANLDKPDYERLDRLDNRYQKDMFDEQSLINNINSNYNKDYVRESSGGSLGAMAANSAAAELNKTRAISEGFQRGEAINRGENTTAQQFNLGVDQQNLNQSNLENDINARNEGNYDTQKSKMISQLGTDLGSIGKEQTFKQMVKDSGLCYDTSGAYICGTEVRLTEDQVKEVKSETNENAKGGMINSNSMFTSYLDYLKNK